ncbi:hypothetical protein NL676_035448 [Syzygium grande]|nr:hypothetical protein NL676_035448 [Syzygium grande]
MMFAALRNERMLAQSPSPFNSDHERFIQHFELLQKAGVPDHTSYQSFEDSTKNVRFSTLVMYNYFKDAQRIAKEVKNNFPNDPDRQSELRRIEQPPSLFCHCCSQEVLRHHQSHGLYKFWCCVASKRIVAAIL